MVYGSLIYDPWGDPYIFNWQEGGHKSYARIELDTVGYYIGLADKNGTPIFSNDVIRVRGFTSRIYLLSGCWLVKTPDNQPLPLYNFGPPDIEVVGYVGKIPRKPIKGH